MTVKDFRDWDETQLTWCDDCGCDNDEAGRMRECPDCGDNMCIRRSKDHVKWCIDSEDTSDITHTEGGLLLG